MDEETKKKDRGNFRKVLIILAIVEALAMIPVVYFLLQK